MPHERFVRIIKVNGVLSISQLIRVVLDRYPDARIMGGFEGAKTALITIPDLLWNSSPQGPEVFFRWLCSSGVISGFHHKRYSDQEEVRY